jgi:hypothetical protein
MKWTSFKQILDNTNCPFIYVEGEEVALIHTNTSNFSFGVELQKSSDDYADFLANYKTKENANTRTHDDTGRILSRHAIATGGNYLSSHSVNLQTSVLGSLRSREWDNTTDCPEFSAKYYKSGLVECADQADADINCTCTQIVFDSALSPEFIDAELRQASQPETGKIYISSVAAPDIPKAMGGEKPFCRGGFDLGFLLQGSAFYLDGRAPKAFKYDPIYNSHRLGIRLWHEAGFKHKIQIRLGYYRP